MVATMEDQRKSLAKKLYKIEAFKFGEFKLKTGSLSPVYFDLRVIVSYPEIMDELTNLMLTFIQEKEIQFDQLCGVPYTALPIATLLSVKLKQPMLIRRKEAKGYGTNKLIEGKFAINESCLIIEDVVTSGSSIYETTVDLQNSGLAVTDAIIVVDREQGGRQNLKEKGIKMHSMFTLSYLLEVLNQEGDVSDEMLKKVQAYIAESREIIKEKPSRTLLSFGKRAEMTKNEVSKKLLSIMDTKKTNLCLAADLTKSEEILNLVESVGPFICLLKTHIDIVEDFNENFVKSLQALAEKHNFLIMEDRKFADIGNTVSLQYSKGVYNISAWADLVTVHSLPGEGILQGLKEALTDSKPRGVFLLAEMSSKDNLISADYKGKTMKIAEAHKDFVAGIVAQTAEIVEDPGLIQLTPGVKIEEGSDSLGQVYNTPEHVIKEKGADIAVVGRGIFSSKNPSEVAKTYRDRLWEAYISRIN